MSSLRFMPPAVTGNDGAVPTDLHLRDPYELDIFNRPGIVARKVWRAARRSVRSLRRADVTAARDGRHNQVLST
jgi:hypothetical protein